MGKTLFIIVDSHLKWIEAFVVPSTSSTATIDKLRQVFATHGLPEVVVSDNGTAFTSKEFKEFVQRNGIEHKTTALYHPSSNGLEERAVQTVKEGLRKMTGPLETRIPRFLLKYRLTPQATTGTAPAELLMGRRIRTHLDLLYPTTAQRVRNQQSAQRESQGTGLRRESFYVGDSVMAHDFTAGNGQKWVFGKVIEKIGETMVQLELNDGRIWCRHLDHIVRSQIGGTPTPPSSTSEDDMGPPSIHPNFHPLTLP